MHLRDTILLVLFGKVYHSSLRGISGALECNFSRQDHGFFLPLLQLKRQDLLKRHNSMSNYGKTIGLPGFHIPTSLFLVLW